MSKIRITPFLILTPIGMIYSVFALILLSNSSGMNAIVAPAFLGTLVISIVFFLIDRAVMDRVNMRTIYVAEIMIALLGYLYFEPFADKMIDFFY